VRARAVVFWLVLATLLAPAALLTLARLAEARTATWIQLEAFTPLGIGLYAVALLIAAARLLVRRRWGTPTSGALGTAAALAAAGLALHCWWFAPLVTGANPPPAPGAETLTVMTANISHGDGDPYELVRRAAEDGVDLLAVEEITAADLADMERAGLSDLLPYHAGEPRSDAHGTMVFASTPLGRAERTATWHDGWVVSLGELVVLATHPQAPTDPDLWRADHAALLDAVLEHHPDLVLGDFNATGDHGPMRALADAGLRDVGELANEGWQPTWPSNGRWSVLGLAVPPLAQIDHVLIGPRLAAISMRTADLPGSDHRAVVAEVARK
jgi:endonuclease/exonuclease/phosphatase (EEP) superfamily protein YafD